MKRDTKFSFQSLGNHEFDEAVSGLIPFISNVTTPVLAANLILDKEPDLEEQENLHKSIVIVKKGVKIGVIGYLTAETKFLAPKNNVEYEDEVSALKREAKRLKLQGVNILIALGHSGYFKDLEIAKNVEDIDLVIGGHSNTFLSNKNTTEIPETVVDLYPKEVKQSSGRIVRVVQAYAYTKYLGKLHLTFDANGEIIECDGMPILLNQDVPRDPELLSMVEKYSYNIDKINNVIVGSSTETLHGDYCRFRECNIGNLITDAVLNHTYAIGHEDIKIAIIQGGRIRASIDRPQKPFEMTREDWFTVIPFTDSLTVVTMNGTILRKSLEHAVDGWQTTDCPGQFLQFSGMRVTYDLAKPPGSRVVTARVACASCEHNELADIENHLEYKVIMCMFLADGGDGFSMFDGLQKEIFSYNEVDSVIYYLNRTGLITQKEEGRIVLLNEDVAIKKAENRINRLMGSNGKLYLPNDIIQCLALISTIFIRFR